METPQRFLTFVASSIVEDMRNDDVVYSTASGVILGLQLAALHPEYGMALLRECQDFLGEEKRDSNFAHTLVEAVPLERTNGNGT